MNVDGRIRGESEQPIAADGDPGSGVGLVLADLLAARGLGLRQLAGPDPARVALRGAHAIEVENPTRWLPAHWAVLTTGIRLRGSPTAQRALIRELAGAGMAALCYATGTTTRTVPAALVDEARHHGFSVLAVPLRTPLHRIIDFVHAALRHPDSDMVQLLVGARHYGSAEADAARGPRGGDPIEALILGRLEALLGVPVALLDTSGAWIWRPGMEPVPPTTVRRLRATAVGGITEVDIAGRVWSVVPVRRGGQPAGSWLLLDAEPHVPREFLSAIWTAVDVLAFVYGVRDTAPANVAALRAQLLSRLIRGGDSTGTDERMRRLGFTLRIPLRVVLTDAAGARAVRVAATADDVPFLELPDADRVLLCLEADDDTLRRVLRGPFADPVAVGRPVGAAGDIAASLRAAEFVSARPGPAGTATYWDDVGVTSWLLTTADPTAARAWADRWLEPLSAQPLLRDAVVAYLRHDQDVGAAAAALRLHPNSLRYRLKRVEDLLGCTLRRPSAIADLYAALVAAGTLHPL